MRKQVTFAIIKPDAVEHRFNIIEQAKRAGFVVRAVRTDTWPELTWEQFYGEHVGKPFYPALIMHMGSAPVTILALEREDAVQQWRSLIGATDPRNAVEGTLRKQFGSEPPRNAVHGSDSSISAAREIDFFFSQADIIAGRI